MPILSESSPNPNPMHGMNHRYTIGGTTTTTSITAYCSPIKIQVHRYIRLYRLSVCFSYTEKRQNPCYDIIIYTERCTAPESRFAILANMQRLRHLLLVRSCQASQVLYHTSIHLSRGLPLGPLEIFCLALITCSRHASVYFLLFSALSFSYLATSSFCSCIGAGL